MNFFKKRLNKKGFTLVELLIVIAVLGIIAGIGVNSMSGITSTFKVNADKQTCEQLARVIEVQVLAGEITPAAATLTSTQIPELGNVKAQTIADKAFVAKLTYADSDLKVVFTVADDAAGASAKFPAYTVDIADAKVE